MLFSAAGELATALNMFGTMPKAPLICARVSARSSVTWSGLVSSTRDMVVLLLVCAKWGGSGAGAVDGADSGRCATAVEQPGDGRGERHVVDLAEFLGAQHAVAVDEDRGGRALHAVAAEGDRRRVRAVRRVDADGERDAVLVQERLEARRRHGLVVFEHGVQ